MDIDDDDRFPNYDNTDLKKLQTFKVPKKNLTNKCSFEKVPLQSNDYKDNIYPKIVTSYKNSNSCTSLKILSAYTICNPEIEKKFNKRKQNFKKDFSSQSATESYGFVYLSNMGEFKNLVKSEMLRIGNLKESVLGKADMGVCVSQFSDIYHPGDGKNFPRNGLLLIVKYLRGRVYYVVEDSNPMEPQPNYDCHISKNYNQESYASMARAFHSTQIYMYEYSDDFDLVDEPSQILPWAAVEFTWVGAPLYKLLSIPISLAPPTSDANNKDSSNKILDKRPRSNNRTTGCPPQRIKQIYTDSTPVFCTQLQLKLPKLQKDDDSPEVLPLDIPVTILSYHSSWAPFDPLMTPCWQICELMEWSAFEKGFIQPLVRDRSDVTQEDNFSLSDVFKKRVTISRNIENKFTKNMIDSMKLATFGTQYVNYFRMVVNEPSRDRAKMARLVEHFLETKTVGRIRINDNSDSLLFVFPDSNLSQNFGIPSVRTLDVNYLHLLLITNKSLDYSLSNLNIDDSVENELKNKLLNACNIQDNHINESIISLNVLRQSINGQNTIQKSKLRQICGIATNVTLKFDEISFKLSINSPIDNVRLEDNTLNVGKKALYKTQNSIQRIESPLYDRPYDPTENLVGLSDLDHGKKLKRFSDVKKSEESPEPSQAKKVKREDMKNELNTKLFQLFAKIESSDSNDSLEVNSAENYTTPAYHNNSYSISGGGGGSGRSNYYQYNRGANSSYASTLDRNKFQTQFRHGVSVYIPESSTDTYDQVNNTMDKDFRFQDCQNQQFLYSDQILRPNGFN